MAQKRPCSASPIQSYKKKATGTLSSCAGLYENVNHTDSADRFQEILRKVVAKQVELVEQLVFKDVECQKLKKKYDEVDRNCRRWHEFAIGLQSRVKRLALILHRQQDSMKNLRNKGACTANAAVQTKSDSLPKYQGEGCAKCQLLLITDSKSKVNSNLAEKPKVEIKKEAETSQSRPEDASPTSSVVIDLTDEEMTQSSIQTTIHRRSSVDSSMVKKDFVTSTHHTSKLAIQPAENLAHGHPKNNGFLLYNDRGKPLAPVQSIGSNYLNSNIRPAHVDTTLRSPDSKNKSTICKSHVMNSIKDGHLAQKNMYSSKISPMKNGTNNTPYPPLPSMPFPPQNLPKHILPQPSQPLLKIRKSKDGIELSWDLVSTVRHVKMDSYELFVYQHNPSGNGTNRWKKIGNDSIKAMPLPMACTLSQFSTGSKYYFAVRGRDSYGRYGAFSAPCCSTDVQQ